MMLLCGDCAVELEKIKSESVDFVLTSPPYDNLRNYDGFSFNFEKIAQELYRVLKKGGVIVWVVGDSTKNGSETGTSFKQALYFKKIGFRLYDTMIYEKTNYMPLNHKRYEQAFEYMFVLSKDMPKTFNPIKIPCKYAGQSNWGKSACYNSNGELNNKQDKVIADEKLHSNIFQYRVGSTTKTKKYKHPAMFPLELAEDMIKTWTNEGDIVLDPMMGSGTTGEVALNLNRDFIGVEISEQYYNMAKERLENEKEVEKIGV